MARVVPQLTEGQHRALRSRAEARVYEACQELWDESTLILFSLPWIRVGPFGSPRDGETDFVVFDQTRGMLTIEVKGGGIECDQTAGRWYSVDRHGVRNGIKDPFEQAKNEKYALRDYLREQSRWTRLGVRPTIGHAVLLPDVDDAAALIGPNRHAEIIGGRRDAGQLDVWLDGVFRFWANGSDPPVGVGAQGLSVLDHMFCRSVEVKPLLSTILQEEEVERIRLTEEQSRLLRGLARHHRAVVSGGAGTGKTLLAVEKTRQLAAAGNRTLLVCYNRPLANHLQHCTSDVSNADVMSFHQLCDWFIRRANSDTGRDLLAEAAGANPGLNKYDVHCPHALALALECLDDRYDAIVVDEAQDFGEEFWLPIEMLLRDEEESTLFLFYDHNQAIYNRVSTFPIKDDAFLLTRNCRNTRHIHEAAYHYYKGEQTEPPSITGDEIAVIDGPSRGSQVKRLHAHLVDLIKREGVRPESIAVLVPSVGHREYYDALEGRPLPHGATWAIEQYGVAGGVRVDTVSRFKGLEATVIYLWGADTFDPACDIEILYVTLSRAKSRLLLAGDERRCRALVDAGGDKI